MTLLSIVSPKTSTVLYPICSTISDVIKAVIAFNTCTYKSLIKTHVYGLSVSSPYTTTTAHTLSLRVRKIHETQTQHFPKTQHCATNCPKLWCLSFLVVYMLSRLSPARKRSRRTRSVHNATKTSSYKLLKHVKLDVIPVIYAKRRQYS